MQDKVLDLTEMKGDTEDLLKMGQDLNAEAWAAIDRLNDNILVICTRMYA